MPQPTREQIQQKMARKFGTRSARTGGKGSLRRKFKAHPKSSTQDDKRLNSSLKKLNVSPIPAIEEVNLFKDDNTVVHFNKPKVQAEIASNTYVVSGNCETKKLEELIPQIIPQLGSEHIESLKNFGRSFNALLPNPDEEDEVVPTLVDENNENFEEVANADEKKQETEQTEQSEQQKDENNNNDNNNNDNDKTNDKDNTTKDGNNTDNNNKNNVNDDNNKETNNDNNDNNDEDMPDLVVPQNQNESQTNNETKDNETETTDNDQKNKSLPPDNNQAVDI